MKTIRLYGEKPFQTALLHGGPGATGEMKPVALELAMDAGIIECLQTENTINGQIEELYDQLINHADLPVNLVGYSWGAWLGFLYACRYPGSVKKLILISAGAFESKYNLQLMQTRLTRLSPTQRAEAERLHASILTGSADQAILEQYGVLMRIADSYDPVTLDNENLEINQGIFRSVWPEASELRESGALVRDAHRLKMPVVAIHGDYDPHPFEGVEKPLSERLDDFKMILLAKCGHTPWNEIQAKDAFFKALRKEIS